MRYVLVVSAFVLAAVFVLVCDTLAHAGPGPLGVDNKLLAPIQFKQLTVFPVVRKAGGADKQYLTLSEGVQKKLVMVSEHGQGGTVNQVQVKNDSDRPLLLL